MRKPNAIFSSIKSFIGMFEPHRSFWKGNAVALLDYICTLDIPIFF